MSGVGVSGGRSRGSRRGSKGPLSQLGSASGGNNQATPGEFGDAAFGDFGGIGMDEGLGIGDQMDDMQSNIDQIR